MSVFEAMEASSRSVVAKLAFANPRHKLETFVEKTRSLRIVEGSRRVLLERGDCLGNLFWCEQLATKFRLREQHVRIVSSDSVSNRHP